MGFATEQPESAVSPLGATVLGVAGLGVPVLEVALLDVALGAEVVLAAVEFDEVDAPPVVGVAPGDVVGVPGGETLLEVVGDGSETGVESEDSGEGSASEDEPSLVGAGRPGALESAVSEGAGCVGDSVLDGSCPGAPNAAKYKALAKI